MVLTLKSLCDYALSIGGFAALVKKKRIAASKRDDLEKYFLLLIVDKLL